MRLYENELGLSGLLLGLLDACAGGRWGEIAGQVRHEYDEVAKAIAVFERSRRSTADCSRAEPM